FAELIAAGVLLSRGEHEAFLPLAAPEVILGEPLLGDFLPVEPERLPTIPGYEVLEKIGGGGMGIVYRARHLNLGLEVALKVMRGDEEAERFRVEAWAVAQLTHPHIVRIYDYG